MFTRVSLKKTHNTNTYRKTLTIENKIMIDVILSSKNQQKVNEKFKIFMQIDKKNLSREKFEFSISLIKKINE